MSFSQRVQLAVGHAQFRALRFMLMNAAGVSAGSVTVDGVTMPYLSRGTGPAVFLVHGFGADKENWLMMSLALSRRYRVVMMDLPGFGAAGDVPSAHGTAKAQAASLAGFADQLGYHRFHLAGNSMGGGIIQRFCADYPERVRSLALLCSVGPEAEPSEVRLALDAGEPHPLIPQSLDDGDAFLDLVMEKRPTVPRALQLYVMSQSIARRHRHEHMWQGWEHGPAADGIPEDLSAVKAPTMVVHGDCDRVIHPSVGAALADQLPDAHLVALEGVGHVPQVEIPNRTARLLNDFWSQI